MCGGGLIDGAWERGRLVEQRGTLQQSEREERERECGCVCVGGATMPRRALKSICMVEVHNRIGEIIVHESRRLKVERAHVQNLAKE